MKNILITGLDGSGKSTLFDRLERHKPASVGVIYVPHIRAEEYRQYPDLFACATMINSVSAEADQLQKPLLKALSLFWSMLLYRELLAVKQAQGCAVVLSERHPLVDTIAYSRFYARFFRNDGGVSEVCASLDERYGTELRYLASLAPDGSGLTDTASFVRFLAHNFAAEAGPSAASLAALFNTKLPDAIYFLDAPAEILARRLSTRLRKEPHETVGTLAQLREAYKACLASLGATSATPVTIIDAATFAALDAFHDQFRIELRATADAMAYPVVPGRGLLSKEAMQLRLDHLSGLGHEHGHLARNGLDFGTIRNKIESVIGTVEIPVGLVGPLRYNTDDGPELVYCPAATLEGALVASMNRGAKAVSLAGGFTSWFIHQKMTRCPLFVFRTESGAERFASWITRQWEPVSRVVRIHSNHARLTDLESVRIQNSVHVTFTYTTGDAAGQNMTTTCTWHAMLWCVEAFERTEGIPIDHYVIEGNGASDKKVSLRSAAGGRGVSVLAECELDEETIRKVLRTSGDAIMRCFLPSKEVARSHGMVGYNINVANAVAAIFLATGQDMASVHESSTSFLNMKKTASGLHVTLHLPCLVIGTVGGGTALAKQKEALRLMGCAGNGGIQRFARLIAGFAMALEVSTIAAIVSGEFAKAHEKLGRNKPANWLLLSDLNAGFLRSCLVHHTPIDADAVFTLESADMDNGIITKLAERTSKKLVGFFPFRLTSAGAPPETILIKSKARDTDVIKGLHLMAASVDPVLSDLIHHHRHQLEYENCHRKEIDVYGFLHSRGVAAIPGLYGSFVNESRDAFLLFQEFLHSGEVLVMNAENEPGRWQSSMVAAAITAICGIHELMQVDGDHDALAAISVFDAAPALPLYEKMLTTAAREEEDGALKASLLTLAASLPTLAFRKRIASIPLTIIHNDFNPRNVAIRNDGRPCIYDWELAVRNIPHRDIVEFLAFVLPADCSEFDLHTWLDLHYRLSGKGLERSVWDEGYVYALQEFLACRLSFYLAAEILSGLGFPKRVARTAFRMLDLLAGEQPVRTHSSPADRSQHA
jgi:hydroxymethylglutaryl-CoA reductase (NADPH)